MIAIFGLTSRKETEKADDSTKSSVRQASKDSKWLGLFLYSISALLCWVIDAVTGIVLFAALLWSACIGWFLDNAAPAQVQEVMFQELLAGHTGGAGSGQ
jgi:chromate transport protein ChrA